MSQYTFYQANLEAGFHLPLGAWDPYIAIHGGYADASFKQMVTQFGPYTSPSASGGGAGGSLGVDYYLAALFSLGVDLTADALFLSVPVSMFTSNGTTVVPVHGGSSTGSLLMGSVHAGLHFDL